MIREERAVVLEVKPDRALLEMDAAACCESCRACTALGGGKMRIQLDPVPGLQPGQTVVVAIDRSMSPASILFLFGFPALGLVAGAVLGQVLSLRALGKDLSSVLYAALLLAGAFLAAVLYDRRVASRTLPRPTILRIEST